MALPARAEVVIVGGGIAGASLAYFLAERGCTDVVLLEREAQPGQHATGRSAAALVEWDPVPELQELKAASAPFFRALPAGFSDHPVLDPSGVLALFEEPMWSVVCEMAPRFLARGTRVELLTAAEVLARVPVLVAERVAGGVLLPDDGRLDVHGLLWSYLGHAARRGVRRHCGVEVTGVRTEGSRCGGVRTTDGDLAARWVVNAAGAWAGRVGTLAGALPIPLVPHRRTIVTFATPAGIDIRGWPFVHHESLRLYFGAESGGLLVSPMDEDAMEPTDARPDEVRVAEALARLETLAPALVPRTLRRTWAGLRTFAPDRIPVVGDDPRLPGFFWLAGQGGCGIETSPTMGRIAAELLLEGRSTIPVAAALAPTRFA